MNGINYSGERARVQSEAERHRRSAETQSRKVEADLRKQWGGREREAEAQKATLREAERLEQRRRDLPLTTPTELHTAEKIAEIERGQREVAKEVAGHREDVKKAKVEALASVSEWEKKSLSAIEQAEREYGEAQKAFEGENVKLDFKDEWAGEAFWGTLDAEQRAYLSRYGSAKFNKWQDSLVVELNTGEVVEREEFNKLAPSQQAYLKKYGIAKFNKYEEEHPVTVTAEGIVYAPPSVTVEAEGYAVAPTKPRPPSPGVVIMAEGYVVAPPVVKPTGITIEAGGFVVAPTPAEIKVIEKEIMAQYPSLKPDDIIAVTVAVPPDAPLGIMTVTLADVAKPELKGKVFGVPIPAGLETFLSGIGEATKVSESELTGKVFGVPIHKGYERSIIEFGRLIEVFAPRIEGVALRREPLAFMSAALLVSAQYFIPGVNLVTRWHEMSSTERAINITIDAAIGVAFLRAGILRVRATRAPMATAATQLLKQEAALAQQTSKIISGSYGKGVATKFMTVVNAQKKYIEALVRLDKLKSAKKPNLTAIKVAQLKADALARNLEAVTRTYTSSLHGVAGFDSPAMVKMMDDLPLEVTRNCRSAVEGLKPIKVNIAQLQADVVKAEARLAEFKAKFPTDPSKWTDLSYDLLLKQSKLAQAKAGSILDIHAKLIELRGQLPKATGATRIRIQAEIYRLEDALRSGIKGMEVEWGRGGLMTFGGRGNIATIIEAPPVAPARVVGGVRIKPVPVKEVTVAGLVMPHLIADYGLKGAEVAKIEPMVHEATKTVTIRETNPEIIREMERLTAKAIREATSLKVQGKTTPEIQARVGELVKTWIEPVTKPQTKAQLKTKIKPMTRIATKVATKIKPKIKLKPRPHIRLPDGTTRPMTDKELEGAVAWKQGFIYRCLYPPYGKDNVINTRKPIPGVKVVKGERSAYLSIVRLNGKIPAKIARDMGIMDVHITTPRRGKPKLRFKRDIRQRTRVTPAVGGMRSG